MKNDAKRDYNFVRSVWLVSMAFFGLKELLQLANDPYTAGYSDIFFGGLGAVMGCIMFSMAWQNRKNPDFTDNQIVKADGGL